MSSVREAWAARRAVPFIPQLTPTDCGAASLASVLGYFQKSVPIHTLRAPEGSMTLGGSSGMSVGGSGNVTNSTQLSTKLKPAEVVAHYDKQMIAAGWTSLSDGAADNVAVHNYRKKDEKERVWTAVLFSVLGPDEKAQDVSLRLSRR